MGYYHFYRIFENKIMMINHSLSDCPSCGQSHIWQKVIWYTENGQRGKRQIASIKLCLKSDGKRKETDILLLQTHTSAFNTNFILLTALKTALNLSSCHPPAIAQTLTQPCIGDQHRERGMCVCVCLSAGGVQDQNLTPEQQNQCPTQLLQQNLPAITGTVKPHLAILCTTSGFEPGSNMFEDFPLTKPSNGNHDKGALSMS